jgi:ADP-ribosyl-[dinitrogen reductase] hydrolase
VALPLVRERAAGGILGLLIGDALGVPYEFSSPEALPSFDAIEMTPPPGFRRAHGVPPGTWSDDGAQALCLAATLMTRNGFHAEDFANRLRNWANVGYLAVDGHVFDIGIQTQCALRNLAAGSPPLQAGPSGEADNGNGALMRVLPLALWHGARSAALVEDAQAQSQVTHGHARSIICCAMLCFIACGLMQGESFALAWERSAQDLHEHCRSDPEARRELEFVLDPLHAGRVRGSGYVLDSLWSARSCLIDDPEYALAVKRAIKLGNDTDTTACIVGGLAGIVHGVDGIPERWRAALRGDDILAPLLSEFVAAVELRG